MVIELGWLWVLVAWSWDDQDWLLNVDPAGQEIEVCAGPLWVLLDWSGDDPPAAMPGGRPRDGVQVLAGGQQPDDQPPGQVGPARPQHQVGCRVTPAGPALVLSSVTLPVVPTPSEAEALLAQAADEGAVSAYIQYFQGWAVLHTFDHARAHP